MPVTAAALADVLVRDADPAMAVGVGDHALEQAAVGLLLGATPGELGLCLADAHDEGVPDALELGGAQQARPADGSDPPLQSLARESRGEQLPEPALEPGDLAAKVLADEVVGGDSGAGSGSGERGGSERHSGLGLRLVAKLGHFALLQVPEV